MNIFSGTRNISSWREIIFLLLSVVDFQKKKKEKYFTEISNRDNSDYFVN